MAGGGKSMSENQRSGLVSYGGDSEISDSEDERVSWSSSPPYPITTVPIVAANTLGIPPSKPRQPATPPFVKPEVHPAPVTGLVDYHLDEEDDVNNSREMDNSTVVDEVFSAGVTLSLQESEQRQDEAKLKPDDDHEADSEVPAIIVLSEDSNLEPITNKEISVPLFLPLSGVCLPPEPQGRCSNSLQDKITTLLKKKAMGIDLNESIQNRKDFRNPSIYEKLVNFCKLDEFGSNYPDHLYNPHEWGEESFYKNLRKAQMKAYEKKERAKLERTKVEFVTGTKRPAPITTVSNNAAEVLKKPRRSKWDISVGSGTESGGSRGASPSRERPPLLGAAPRGMQPLSMVGAQAKVQATQLSKEINRLKGK